MILSTRFIFIWITVILSFHFLAIFRGWYWEITWLDIPMHLAGGALVALFWLWLRERLPEHIKPSRGIFDFITVIGIVALVGVLWEMYEFIQDLFWGRQGITPISQESMADTMKDLFMDLIGGSVAYIYYSLIRLFRRR